MNAYKKSFWTFWSHLFQPRLSSVSRSTYLSHCTRQVLQRSSRVSPSSSWEVLATSHVPSQVKDFSIFVTFPYCLWSCECIWNFADLLKEMPKHRASKYVNPNVEEKSLLSVAGSFFGGLTGKIEPAQVSILVTTSSNVGSRSLLRWTESLCRWTSNPTQRLASS